MMKRYILLRFMQLIPILFGITFVSFLLMYAAGSDAVIQKYSLTGQSVSQAVIEAERRELGLDRPMLLQYAAWLHGVLQGDMGRSFVTGADVFGTFLDKLPATLLLTLLSVLLTLAISLPLGILAALRQDSRGDLFIRLLSFLGSSMPNFFVALLLMYFLAIQAGLLPVISGGSTLSAAVLPTLTLAIAMSSRYTRQIRGLVLEELSQGYVAGARARGVPFRQVLARSIMRAALPTLLTLLALSVGSLLGGTAIVESIFMWDGVGKMAVDAINTRDYPVIEAYVLWMGIIYVAVNLVTDIACKFLDPRLGAPGTEGSR